MFFSLFPLGGRLSSHITKMVVSCAAWDSPRLDMVTAVTCIKASAVGRYLSLVLFARNIPEGNFYHFLTIGNFSVHPIFVAFECTFSVDSARWVVVRKGQVQGQVQRVGGRDG